LAIWGAEAKYEARRVLEVVITVAEKTVFPVLIVFLLAGGAFADRYSGGTGEPNNPYRIGTPNDLNDIGNHVEDFNKCFVLVNDINLADYTGTEFNIIGNNTNAFTGVFDGNDHIISKLTIDTVGADNDDLGLFGRIGETGEVKNTGIEDVNITGGDWSGRVGGLCGCNDGGLIRNCYATGSVTGENYSWDRGGLCGANWSGTIRNCYATGSVSVGDFSEYLGSLCGYNSDGTIRNCYATGSVSVGGFSWGGIGGLVGSNDGIISNCYATGSVSGGDNLGVGGLVGVGDANNVTTSFWDIETTGQASSDGGTCKTTTEMQTESTFTDAAWDFVEVWDIGENQTYPFLRVYPAGDSNHDGIVNFRDVAILAGHWLEEK
jgi:hypothetical protein